MQAMPSSQQVRQLRYIGETDCVVYNQDGKVFLLKAGRAIESNLEPT